MSAGVTYVVPDSHCILEIVGLGGINAWALKTLSSDRVRSSPAPQTFSIAISDGPVQPRMSPVLVMIASANLLLSKVSSTRAEASSLSPGIENALARPSPVGALQISIFRDFGCWCAHRKDQQGHIHVLRNALHWQHDRRNHPMIYGPL